MIFVFSIELCFEFFSNLNLASEFIKCAPNWNGSLNLCILSGQIGSHFSITFGVFFFLARSLVFCLTPTDRTEKQQPLLSTQFRSNIHFDAINLKNVNSCKWLKWIKKTTANDNNNDVDKKKRKESAIFWKATVTHLMCWSRARSAQTLKLHKFRDNHGLFESNQ